MIHDKRHLHNRRRSILFIWKGWVGEVQTSTKKNLQLFIIVQTCTSVMNISLFPYFGDKIGPIGTRYFNSLVCCFVQIQCTVEFKPIYLTTLPLIKKKKEKQNTSVCTCIYVHKVTFVMKIMFLKYTGILIQLNGFQIQQ